jgi:hypothetical protein
MSPVTLFRFEVVYLMLLISKNCKLFKLPIAVGIGPCKFAFVKFKDTTLVFVASHFTPTQTAVQGSVPATQVGKLACQSFAIWIKASPSGVAATQDADRRTRINKSGLQ